MDYKFANYRYHGKNINNLGDHVQVWTIDYLYSLIGVKKEEIVYIDINDLKTYDGIPVVLPVSLPLINHSEHGMADMFSKKIKPVFFGITTPRTELLVEEINFYKKHEPIGCRDEQAYNTMSKYGIKAYLGGCLTIALPRRKKDLNMQKKVFIVDPPENFKKFIPKDILKDAILDTHIYYDYMEDPSLRAIQQYKKYKNEAALVITGLLHASIPCLAFGIPVVLARDCVSYRFAWVESILNIFTPDEYEDINWQPSSIDVESLKNIVINLFKKRMLGKDAHIEEKLLHNFYMDRKRKEYCNDVFLEIQNFIDRTWIEYDKEYKYAVWGLTQMATLTVDYITQRYPNAILTHVYDIKEGLSFRGMTSVSPNNIVNYPEETVFVTTVSAADTAENYFKEIGKLNNMYKTLKIIR